jgi:hypothetical protein
LGEHPRESGAGDDAPETRPATETLFARADPVILDSLGAALIATCLLPSVGGGAAPGLPQVDSIRCRGASPKHLQGVGADDRGALYWSFTVELVKTDVNGKVLRSVPVADHHGDLCVVGGKVYVAVNLGEFNRPAGRADSWVFVYDAETLEGLSKHHVPEVVHGAGGIAHHDGTFLVVGGLPPGTDGNLLYEYDESFAFLRRHVLASGYTLMGIQTAAFAEGAWWFGCYGDPRVLLKADEDLRLLGRWDLDASLGIVGVGGGRLLVAEGLRDSSGYSGVLRPFEVAGEDALRRIETRSR